MRILAKTNRYDLLARILPVCLSSDKHNDEAEKEISPNHHAENKNTAK